MPALNFDDVFLVEESLKTHVDPAEVDLEEYGDIVFYDVPAYTDVVLAGFYFPCNERLSLWIEPRETITI